MAFWDRAQQAQLDSVAGDVAQSGQMVFERPPAERGQREPSARALTDVTFLDLHDSCGLQRGHLLGKDRVRHLHGVSNEGELRLIRACQGGDNAETDGRVNRFVQPVTRVHFLVVGVRFGAHRGAIRLATRTIGRATSTQYGPKTDHEGEPLVAHTIPIA